MMACRCNKKWDSASTYTTIAFTLTAIIVFIVLYLVILKKKVIVGGLSIMGVGAGLVGLGYLWRKISSGTVQNCSEVEIFAKPEDGTDPILVPPGSSLKGIDGVWAPWFPDKVFKVPNGVHVCFDTYGREIYPNALSWESARSLGGGWYHENEIADKLGSNWKEFYDRAKSLWNVVNAKL